MAYKPALEAGPGEMSNYFWAQSVTGPVQVLFTGWPGIYALCAAGTGLGPIICPILIVLVLVLAAATIILILPRILILILVLPTSLGILWLCTPLTLILRRTATRLRVAGCSGGFGSATTPFGEIGRAHV